jgi:hypothetical protein
MMAQQESYSATRICEPEEGAIPVERVAGTSREGQLLLIDDVW